MLLAWTAAISITEIEKYVLDRVGSLKYLFDFEIVLDSQKICKDNPETHCMLVAQCRPVLTPCVALEQVSPLSNPNGFPQQLQSTL